ncbi:hypothetical protein CGRA01v4_03531 [Colletotrichum graminicola]|uniref:A-kinase anchor protein 7-like phosphoesterase domain-containing protein n=1 Tax=Colletotrichum graminicola (strain M1.001 / M2 / FGSC 10212) TaxID=645133 RepID=E3QAG2_COLGM|nr:uncharacterized protein GLRG_02994 [Colletotrichum graminicola M1.001]EFQ27850.1 hypothetical protein GLRG_02994 [Colletotrichum graminicola M1.001]WDK12252.1 hypothetical protein CGRA01v4_03531 [Colletotrichum graminicola]
MKPTHFLCIPLVTTISQPQLTKSLDHFKADITSPRTYGIPAAAVRPLSTIHLTLGVMSFPEGRGLDKAVEVLDSIKPLLPTSPPRVSLQGLGTFPGTNTRHADILFAHPTCPGYNFDGLCHQIRAKFENAGLIDKNGFGLSLHATIINARKTPNKGIDATKIIQQYRDYVWMNPIPVEKIGICRMGAEKKGPYDEEYPIVASINF